MEGDADEQLTDAWLACRLGRAISHDEHLRISFVLLQRFGREEGARRIGDGTRRNCAALGASDRYDDKLTQRWTDALADAIEGGEDSDAEAFLSAHPRFRDSGLFGPPAWRSTPA